jgi:hypothetical protein
LQKQEKNTISAETCHLHFCIQYVCHLCTCPEEPQRRKRSHRDVTKIANCETVVLKLSGEKNPRTVDTKLQTLTANGYPVPIKSLLRLPGFEGYDISQLPEHSRKNTVNNAQYHSNHRERRE